MRYLCPVCEHELTARFYCPECRRLIKEPLEYSGSYLPNEMDPSRYSTYQDDCDDVHEFGVPNKDPHSGHQKTENGRVLPNIPTSDRTKGLHQPSSQKKTYSRQTTYQKTGTGQKTLGNQPAYGQKTAAGERAARERKTRKNIVLIIILIYLLFGILSVVMNTFRNRYDSWMDDQPESEIIYDQYDDVAQKIMNNGEPCTGYYHYDRNGYSFQEDLVERFYEAWPEESLSLEMLDAVLYEDDSYTYYEQPFFITTHGDSSVYIQYVQDYVTDDMMMVTVYAPDREKIIKASEVVYRALHGDEDFDVAAAAGKLIGEMGSGVASEVWGDSDVYLRLDTDGYQAMFFCTEDAAIY